MLRSMFTAIGGLRNHQVMLDVTANNIANVNTVGFKAQRVTFETMMSQTMAGASAPVAGGIGGTGPTQVGLGMKLGGIGSLLTQGSLQTTGQWSDVAISGEGYFIVGDAVDGTTGAPTTDTQYRYTRSGNFTTDRSGNLVTTNGWYVLGQASDGAGGFTADAMKKLQVPTNAASMSIDATGVVQAVVPGSATPQIIGRIALAKFPNPAGLMRESGNMYSATENSGAIDPANQAGEVGWGGPATGGRGAVAAGSLEMSNVDLALEFTQMITAQRGFQANTRVISTSDEMLQELVNLKR